jgi:AraC-like DNA-binding protein
LVFNRIKKSTNRIKMDKLDSLLTQSLLTSQVFHAGPLLQAARTDGSLRMGGMHVLREGHLSIRLPSRPPLLVTESSLILCPRPIAFDLVPELGNDQTVEIVCANVDFGQAMSATLMRTIPDFLVMPFSQSPHLSPLLPLLFQEASNQNCGRQAAMNHLMNYFLVLLLRQLMEGAAVKTGIMAALADRRLAIAVTAMHDQPHIDWTLESLAEKAGMSRASFANHFRSTTGTTALGYLTAWRMEVAKTLLRKGTPLKMIAPKVGYGSTEALIRSFLRYAKLTPKDWLNSIST